MANRADRVDVDPVSNNLNSVTPVPPPVEAIPRLSAVLRAGIVTGVTASLLCWLLFGIGTLFGTEFDIHLAGSSGVTHVPWYVVVLMPFLLVMAYAALSASLRDRPGCRRLCLTLGYSLGLLGVIAFLFQPEQVTWPTRIWLALMVIVTVVISVPQIARVVGDSDPKVTAGHRRLGLDAS